MNRNTNRIRRTGFSLFYAILTVLVSVCVLAGLFFIVKNADENKISSGVTNHADTANVNIIYPTEPEHPKITYPDIPDSAKEFGEEVISEVGVLLDLENNSVIAERDCQKKIYPASLTKIMTLIVAVENIEDYSKTFTMTHDILSPLYADDASMAGFSENEKITMTDLLYGTILPSGADAATGLAISVSGSESEFVKLMNEKAERLGLKNTHFMNCTGLHDDKQYSTAVDIAVMLEYALQDDMCREILSTYQYKTKVTKEHPEGILLESTMFSRMYGDEAEGVTILGGKTGYTAEAGNCLASFAVKDGKEYIAVTVKGQSKWKPIFDSFEIYEKYIN